MLAVLALSVVPASAAPVGRTFGTFAPQAFSAPDEAAAAAYCTSKGGAVQRRIPVFGTNNPSSQWLVLSGSADFCVWTANDSAQSRIYTLLTTLYTTMPTLAALAYESKIPEPKSCQNIGGANPSSCYCTYLGGSDQFGGANLAGGAWVFKGKTPDVALQTCIFPDLSSIDSWGLFYHSAGIIRGIDLNKVLRYHKPK